MESKVITALRSWKRFTREIEGVLTDNIAAMVPWFAPVIPAWIAWDGMTATLHFTPMLASIGAVVVEFLGFSAITTAIQFVEYNNRKRKTDQAAPVLVAIVAVVFYMAVILTVNVLLDDAPPVNRLAKGLLSSLSLVGAIILAVRSQHARRLSDIETERIERRQLKLSTNLQQVAKPSNLQTVRSWRSLPPEDKTLVGTLTIEEITQAFGVTERTAYNWKEHLNGQVARPQ